MVANHQAKSATDAAAVGSHHDITGPRRRRRVSRDHERSQLLVALAMPAGTHRADRPGQWLKAVHMAIESELWCESKKRAVWTWALEVASHVDMRTMTTRYTNAEVLRATGKRSVTTMKTYRLWAESRGLLAEVAGGRKGVYAPRRTNAKTDAEGRTVYVNDAAIRVLILKKEVYEALTRSARCGEKMTPSPKLGFPTPPRAREKTPHHKTEPLRGTTTESQRLAALRPGQWFAADHYRPWWSRTTTKSKDNEVVAQARLLAEYALVLRATTDHWIAHVIKPFSAVGWTVADMLYAIDHKPAGERWRIATASVKRPEHWLRYRLAHWTDECGRPLESVSQKAARAHERNLAALEAVRLERANRPAVGRAETLTGMIRAQRSLIRAVGETTARRTHLAELEAELEAIERARAT